MKDILEGVSPRPWKIKYTSRPYMMEGNFHVLVCEGDFPPCFVPAWDQPRKPEEDGADEALANAHFIVHAANTYEARDQLIAELVEALENYAGHVDTPISRRKLALDVPDVPKWLVDARATLTRAKEVMKG